MKEVYLIHYLILSLSSLLTSQLLSAYVGKCRLWLILKNMDSDICMHYRVTSRAVETT